MSQQIGISQTAIDKHIKTLKEKQIIVRIGSDRSGIWHIRSSITENVNMKHK